MTTTRFEYRVCQVQECVTYVNGNWQGRIAPAQGNVREGLSSCLLEWGYPNTAGEDGWEIVNATGGSAATAMRAWCT